MNQLGRSVFIFCDIRSETEVQEILTSYSPDLKTFKSSINENKTFYKEVKNGFL
jgi:hypothetical protein